MGRAWLLRLAGALVLLTWAAGGVAQAASRTVTFTAPGRHSFTVPPGVRMVTAIAVGAAGGDCRFSPDVGAGGRGAAVTVSVPVSPDQNLFVGVGAPGAPCGHPGGGAGGIGGGGNGGAGNPGAVGGAGGGGASVLGLGSPSPGVGGLLVVAGAGGGAAYEALAGGGGASGSAGQGINRGDPGSLTAGGAAGGDCHCSDDGTAGSFGLGGSGGGGPSCPSSVFISSGGGGGGGGYYGGGGAGYCRHTPDGSGGGGGSSYVSPSVTLLLPPALTDGPAAVAITYAAPTAPESTTAIGFGVQAPGTASVEQAVTVTNRGSAPLLVSRVLVGGDDPDDFLIDNRCRQAVAVGSSCQVGVRFDPQLPGARSASLTLITNAARQPGSVALSGGQATRSRSRRGKLELLTCRRTTDPSRHSAHRGATSAGETCTGELVGRSLHFISAGTSQPATLERGRVVYGTGVSAPAAGGDAVLLVSDRRVLVRGLYALIIRPPGARRRRMLIRLR